jgi:hypothetical protein
LVSSVFQVQWARSKLGSWCQLEEVDAHSIDTSGVFVLWHGGRMPRTLRIGHGAIGQRLAVLQQDPGVRRYRHFGPLYVTWTKVQPQHIHGVMRYLAVRLSPVFEDPARPAAAIPVNLPA